jgi:acetamidase/formamidase
VWDREIPPVLEVESGSTVQGRQTAYAIESVAVDLRIDELVDAPNWVVGAFLPDSIFTEPTS